MAVPFRRSHRKLLLVVVSVSCVVAGRLFQMKYAHVPQATSETLRQSTRAIARVHSQATDRGSSVSQGSSSEVSSPEKHASNDAALNHPNTSRVIPTAVEISFQRVLRESATGIDRYDEYTSCDATLKGAEVGGDAKIADLLTWSSNVRKSSRLLRFVKSTTPRVFLVGLLHQSCELMTHYVTEILKFVLIYGADTNFQNLFVSIYEGGSDDCTPSSLAALKDFLDTLSVPNAIKIRQLERPRGTARIDFLQMIRNAAMEPLYLSDESYDVVVFLSDTFFCASDVVRLLRHTDASIKCGMDFDGVLNGMKFRDTWVAHDISGRMFNKEFPYVHDKASANALRHGEPFQVSCCWNGLTVLNASLFNVYGARFRRSLDDTECHGAETELVCHDFAALGYPNVLVDPSVTVAYSKTEYVALSRSKQSVTSFIMHRTNIHSNLSAADVATVKSWTERPFQTECAPLDGHTGDHPDRSRVYQVNWRAHYKTKGVPVASDRRHVVLHSCLGPSARQCKLSHGKRIFPNLGHV